MRLLDRYLFRELLAPFAYCLVGIQSVVILITVFSDAGKIQDAKLHFGGVIEYAAAASMDYLTLVLPVSVLLGLLMTLTNHTRYNEITAMRAAGISLWRICAPYFVLGLMASAAVFALNELLVPQSADWAYWLLHHNEESAQAAPAHIQLNFTNEHEHRKWVVKEYYPGTGDMFVVQVTSGLPDGSRSLLKAQHAVRTNDVWTFYNVQEFVAPSNAAAEYAPVLKTNVVAMPDFDETPLEIRSEIKINNYLGSGGLHTLNLPLKETLTYLRWHQNLSRRDKGRLLTELQERIASPLTCVVAALIAIPFGAAPGRRNLLFGVAGSIFIFFAYYGLQQVGLALGSGGTWPAWLAAWLPNLFFGALGLILMARIR